MSILETLAERRIVEALRAGAFDGLRGAGQPLRLESEEHVPPEWRAAFHLLRQAGLAPEWVVLGREIEADLAEARRKLAASDGGADARRHYQVEIDTINRKVDRFNLMTPHPSLQRPRLRPES
jgi:DnaJ homologue, subfamily C, member 28, conserved domain